MGSGIATPAQSAPEAAVCAVEMACPPRADAQPHQTRRSTIRARAPRLLRNRTFAPLLSALRLGMEAAIATLSSTFGLVVAVGTVCAPVGADAQSDPYHITANERAACMLDAERLCAGSYPDEGRLLSCMQTNRASLTPNCLLVFDAGLKRRHLFARKD